MSNFDLQMHILEAESSGMNLKEIEYHYGVDALRMALDDCLPIGEDALDEEEELW